MAFPGVPRNVLCTPVPDPILGPLLEEIQDVAELKVTLRGIWLLKQKGRSPRTLSQGDFYEDPVLLRGLQGDQAAGATAIQRGLRLAVARGTLLCAQPESAGPEGRLYLLNTETDRNALVRNGWRRLAPEDLIEDPDAANLAGDLPAANRPNIFALYEDNVGTIGPMIAEELKAAEERYPWPWINEAFGIAVNQNKLSWRYISAILRRWAAEGRAEPTSQNRNQETSDASDKGTNGGRNDGEPGRYSKKDNRQKYLADYQRRWGGIPRS